MNRSAGIYRAIVAECERQRLALGWPMWSVDEKAGTQDGYYGKAIYPDTPSGRQAQWNTLDLIVGALFGPDFQITLKGEKTSIQGVRCIEKGQSTKSVAVRHWRHRSYFRAIGELGTSGKHYVEKVPKARRVAIARKAIRARWKQWRGTQSPRSRRKAKAANAAARARGSSGSKARRSRRSVSRRTRTAAPAAC